MILKSFLTKTPPARGQVRFFLVAAAACDLAVAALHVYIIAQGAWAYRWFGAGEDMARWAEEGSPIPALVTSGIVIACLLAAAYYVCAAAGWRPPLLRTGLVAVAAVYMVRATALAAPVVGVSLSPFMLWTSLVSLAFGLVHVTGTYLYWRATRRPAADTVERGF